MFDLFMRRGDIFYALILLGCVGVAVWNITHGPEPGHAAAANAFLAGAVRGAAGP